MTHTSSCLTVRPRASAMPLFCRLSIGLVGSRPMARAKLGVSPAHPSPYNGSCPCTRSRSCPGGRTAVRELMRDLGDAVTKMARGRKIGRRRGTLRPLVDVRLGADAEPETQTVQVGLRAARGVVAGRKSEIDPVHAVLRGKQRERHQGRELVAGATTRIGESCSDLVLPQVPFGHHGLGRWRPERP